MTPTDLLAAALFIVTAGIGWRLRRPEPMTGAPVPVRTKAVETLERRWRRGGCG